MKAPWIRSIGAVPCQCLLCGWAGLTGATEANCDGDGGLGCPSCRSNTPVTVYCAPHEMHTPSPYTPLPVPSDLSLSALLYVMKRPTETLELHIHPSQRNVAAELVTSKQLPPMVIFEDHELAEHEWYVCKTPKGYGSNPP